MNWANLVPDGVFWPNDFPRDEDRPDTIEKRIEQILWDGPAEDGRSGGDGSLSEATTH